MRIPNRCRWEIQLTLMTLFLATLCNVALGENLTVTLHASAYEIVPSSDGLHEIQMDGFGKTLIPGKPALPARSFFVAVPPGAHVVSVDVHPEGSVEFAERYQIAPAAAAAPLMLRETLDEQAAHEWQENRDAIYLSDNAFPTDAGLYRGKGAFRQYDFVEVAYCPFTYYPASERLVYHPMLDVSIEYTLTDDPIVTPVDTEIASEARKLVVNFDDVESWYGGETALRAPSMVYDYLVVTTDELETAVTPLTHWKQTIGFGVKVVTTSWIEANYSGADQPERVRNFLIDKYLEWGTRYLLLAGNIDVLAMRQCFPDSSNHGYDQWFCPPTDYYYADLTGDWDSDGDGFFGEYGQDDVDFIPELSVGRIPYSDSATMAKICQKLATCEADTGPWKQNALLVGTHANLENQNYGGLPETDFAVLMEKMIGDMLPGWTYTTMYETQGLGPSAYPCDIPITEANLINEWGTGHYGVVNWGGHGAWYGTARLVWNWDDGDGVAESGSPSELSTPLFISTADPPYLDDAYPSIVFATSCLNAKPEAANLARELLLNGASGTLASTRPAWYSKGWVDEMDGLVASLDYYFFEYLINQNRPVGDALYESKVRYYTEFFAFEDHYRNQHNLFDYVLYGDPAMVRSGITVLCVDRDGDGFGDPGQPEPHCELDNCVDIPNANQSDFDGDGFGDVCDMCMGVATVENRTFMTGDVNADGSHSSADVIELVNYVFKSGPEPVPGAAFCDTNCDYVVTSSDVIQMVNFVFKGGTPPGDVCTMYVH